MYGSGDVVNPIWKTNSLKDCLATPQRCTHLNRHVLRQQQCTHNMDLFQKRRINNYIRYLVDCLPTTRCRGGDRTRYPVKFTYKPFDASEGVGERGYSGFHWVSVCVRHL